MDSECFQLTEPQIRVLEVSENPHNTHFNFSIFFFALDGPILLL